MTEPPEKGDQVDQIVDPEARPPARDNNEWIVWHHARPPGGQRSEVPFGSPVEDPVFTPVVAVNDEVELLTELRVERVRDPDRVGQISRAGCS